MTPVPAKRTPRTAAPAPNRAPCTLPAMLMIIAAAGALLLRPAAAVAQDQPAPATPPAPAPPSTPPPPSMADSASTLPPSPPPWTIQINPRVWYASPSGKLKLPATTTPGDSVRIDRFGFDAPRLSPAGELQINADPWRFTFAGAAYSVDHSTTADEAFRVGDTGVSVGDSLHGSYDFATFELTASYCFWRHDFRKESADPAAAVDAVVSFHALGGVRFYETNIIIDSTPAAPGAAVHSAFDRVFLEPIIGFRIALDVTPQFSMELLGEGGGFPESNRSSFSWDMAIALAWRPCPNVAAQIGWRQVAFSLTDGSDAAQFKNTGAVAGLFLGLVLRF